MRAVASSNNPVPEKKQYMWRPTPHQ